jgi:small subunit ribosomal protein S17|tara:strand:+ start:7222 stop:7674 length:453 start_codon:yes stop_codon:yes gene_type:complete
MVKTKMEVKNMGIKVERPKEKCNDSNCPFHGSLKCRGRIFTGTIILTNMQKTATVEWEHRYFLRKYERYEKRRSRVKAHNPGCLNAQDGDIVKITECRPLSKTKNFVIVGILGKEKGFKEKMEAQEESKVKKEVKKAEEQTDGAEEEVTV